MADSIVLAEQLTKKSQGQRALTDSIGISEQLGRFVVRTKNLSDNVGAVTVVTPPGGSSRSRRVIVYDKS